MRDFRCGWTALLPMLVGCLLRLGTGVAWGDDSSDVPESLRQAIEKAERILVAVPSEDLEVAPGKPFLVDVERALRGSGARGSRARIIQGEPGISR